MIKLIGQGVSPENMALTVSIGIALGILPIFLLPTLLTLAVAFFFRLNVVAIQVINYVTYPLWASLFIPFISMGNALFDYPPVTFSVQQIWDLLQEDWLGTIRLIWLSNLRGVVAWLLIAPPIAFITYFSTLPFFRKVAPGKKKPVSVDLNA